ncbi:hypothetical protein Pan216_35630 [Planctomycetes bacterium Pan216]|uniref:Transposase n=1 Tax=Kolteria novifilia TaxID=2527975 RepID=A0A518B6U9_9BACT|nr:hypothetical protein Pan216_35630 [Planctomycetes bacterium Pan216]
MENVHRSPEKEAYWRKVVHRQEESGQSVRRFCREEGISEASFYGWRRERKRCNGGVWEKPEPA